MPKTETREVQTCKLHPNVALVYEHTTHRPPTHPPDLSTEGMFFNTSQHFPIGAVLRLEVQLPLSNAELLVKARVRELVPGAGASVEFLDLSPQAVEAIERELQMMSAALSPDAAGRQQDKS